MSKSRTNVNPRSLARSSSLMGLGVVPALCLILGVGACGGSTSSPPRDAGADRGTGTGGAGGSPGVGTGGTGGTVVPGGTGGTAAGTGGASTGTGGGTAAGTGGASTGTGGTSAGTGGAAAGTGGATTDAGTDAPPSTQPDAVFPFDLPIPTDLTLPDGAPAIIPCPTDVASAACTNNTVCLRSSSGGMPEACGCSNDRWFCPSFFDAGTGVPTDAFPDVPGIAPCPTGTTNGGACAAENEVCAGGPGLGCACVNLIGGLRWLCL